uniref:DUF4211 domain-containing protein n=1 Tax=Meloidogyne enterolobii TaxID=390850 RepID=A0A6V7VQ31_MELEN|nr:unnamed protein product [Meloidogyne enterolobii]
MEPKNNLHSQNNSNTGGPFLANSAVSGGASDSNNADIFSTLCNLATTTNNSGFNSQSQLLFPNIQNEWNNNSNNWFDQAKLSLFPMYGLLQANNNNTNEFSHNSMGTDRNLHHQTSNNFIQSAPPFNLVENLQSSFGLLYNNNTMTNTTLANPLQSPPGIMQQHLMHQQSPLKHNISNYSHSTASDSDCTPHSNPPSSNLSHQLIISPTQPSSIIEDHQLNNLHSSQVEPLDEFMFDLQDFEEFFMETPSTSYQQQQHPMDPSTPFSQHSDCPLSNKPTDNISANCGTLNNSICNKFCQEELANADKEVDRLVSMVAHKNNIQKDREAITTTNNSSGFQQHSIASLFSLNCSPSTSSSVLPQIPKTEASLEMPHFTPPDSPSPTSTTIAFDDHSIFNSSLNNNQQLPQQLTTTSTSFNNQNKQQFGNSRHSSFGSSTSSTAALPSFSSPPTKTTLKKSPLSFIPTNSTPQNQLIDPLKLNHLAMSRSKNNDKRIPIYKRNNNAGTTTNIGGGRSLSFIESFMKSEAGTKKDSSQTAEDAFNFDEDFDDKTDNNELIPLKSPQKMIHSQTDKQRLGEQEKAKRKYTKRKGIIEDTYTTTNNVLREVEHKQQPKARPLLAEQIKMRRPIGTFLNSEIAKDDNAAICEAVPAAVCTLKNVETSCSNNDTDFKPLPKLVIRILRRTESSTTTEPPLLPTPTELNEVNNNFQQQQKHKKKKHKKNKKEKDVDWTETDECLKSISKKNKKHREHHKSKRRDSKGSIGSLDYNETENNNNLSPEYIPTTQQPLTNNNRRDSFSPEIYSGIPTTTSTCLQKEEENLNNNFNEDSTSFSSNFCERLNFIERPTENPKKGTFLLAKEDLFKLEENSVALWRIDNQNLLQKYIPFVVEEEREYKGEIHYKNSQTYSGWSPDFVDYHIVVRVEYIKKSRSDNIVRPLLPLQDLFPVVCSTINGAEDKSIVKVSQPEPLRHKFNVKETQLIEHLKVFVEIMLKHAITLQFVQNIRENNDWNYLCSMTEIETKIKNCLQNICSENDRWLPSFLEALNNFPNIFFLRDFNDHSDEQQSCQACLLKCLDVNQAIQLYTEEVYDTETIVPKMLTNCENTVCNIDFYLCNKCADAALKYHKIYHLRYSIFKASEMKLELTSTEHPEYSVEQVIEQCKNDTEWVENLCIEGANVILSE